MEIGERDMRIIEKKTGNDVDKKNFYQNHHIIKGARILSSDKISSKEIYSILISIIWKNYLKTQL